MMRYLILRMILKIATFLLRIYEPGTAPIPLSKRTLVFSRIPEEPIIREGLIKAYQQIFREPPWEEEWTSEEILMKLQRELQRDSFLVLLRGDEEWPVAGFSWGAVLPVDGIEAHIASALKIEPVGLARILKRKKVDRLLYFHEFALLKEFRRGLEPLRNLLRPGLELGWSQGVRQTMFWSTPESKIVPLALYVGYEPIFQIFTEKEIIFLFNPDFTPLLKITHGIKKRKLVQIFRASSHFLRGARK